MNDESAKTVPGAARCPGVSWDELAQRDTNPVPAFLRENAYRYMGLTAAGDIPVHERGVLSQRDRAHVAAGLAIRRA
jgi:hypothetical protein